MFIQDKASQNSNMEGEEAYKPPPLRSYGQLMNSGGGRVNFKGVVIVGTMLHWIVLQLGLYGQHKLDSVGH